MTFAAAAAAAVLYRKQRFLWMCMKRKMVLTVRARWIDDLYIYIVLRIEESIN